MSIAQCPECGKIVGRDDAGCPECGRAFADDEPVDIGKLEARPTVYLRMLSWIAYAYAALLGFGAALYAASLGFLPTAGRSPVLGLSLLAGLTAAFALVGRYTQPRRRSRPAWLAAGVLFAGGAVAGFHQLLWGATGGLYPALLCLATLGAWWKSRAAFGPEREGGRAAD